MVVSITLVCGGVPSWFTMEQVVDLKAEGLWDELLDEFQPEIAIQDWWVNKHKYKQQNVNKLVIVVTASFWFSSK